MALSLPPPGPSTVGAAPAGEFRILRLKRKRNEEPLDGLLIEAAFKAEYQPECTSPNEARRPQKKRKKRNSNAAQVLLDSQLQSQSQPQSQTQSTTASASTISTNAGQPIFPPTSIPVSHPHLSQSNTSRSQSVQHNQHPQQQPKGMFQYAATITDVRDEEWEDPKWRKQLEDRLKTMAASGEAGSPTKEAQKIGVEQQQHQYQQQHQPLHPKRYAVKLAPKVSSSGSGTPGAKNKATKVSKNTNAAGVDIVEVEMYDAVSVGTTSEEEEDSSREGQPKTKVKSPSKPSKPSQPEEVPDEVAAFLPMLEEYLRINDTPAKFSHGSKGLHSTGVDEDDDDDDDDYVWDVYYHRPLTLSEWNNMDAWGNGAAGAYSGSGGRVFGTLTGLPPSGVMDPDELSDGESDDSSFDDEADEDSNAEEWYQNDYPEEEDEVSDDYDDDDDDFYDGRDDSEEEPDYDLDYGNY